MSSKVFLVNDDILIFALQEKKKGNEQTKWIKYCSIYINPKVKPKILLNNN